MLRLVYINGSKYVLTFAEKVNKEEYFKYKLEVPKINFQSRELSTNKSFLLVLCIQIRVSVF